MDTNYAAALKQLSSHENCEILGYVHVSWGRRNDREIQSEVQIYRMWADLASDSVTIKGIFFDEWPSDISLIPRMRRLVSHVAENISDGCVITNPGTIVDPKWHNIGDYTVIFENTESTWHSVSKHIMEMDDDELKKVAVVMHSGSGGGFGLEMPTALAGVFWTSSTNYHEWCPSWSRFISKIE